MNTAFFCHKAKRYGYKKYIFSTSVSLHAIHLLTTWDNRKEQSKYQTNSVLDISFTKCPWHTTMSFYCVFAMSANAAKSDFFCWVYLRTILDYNVASNYIKYLIWQIRRHAYYCSCTIRTKVYEAIMICNLKIKNYFQIIKWYIFHIWIIRIFVF